MIIKLTLFLSIILQLNVVISKIIAQNSDHIIELKYGATMALLDSSGQYQFLIRFPIEIRSPHNDKHSIGLFKYFIDDVNIEFKIATFCEKFELNKIFCSSFYDRVIDINLAAFEHIRTQIMPNTHLKRYDKAITDEINVKHGDERRRNLLDTYDEKVLLQKIVQELLLNRNSSVVTKRVCLIHSCVMPGPDPYSILMSIINNLIISGLAYELDNIWILNYGIEIPPLRNSDTSNDDSRINEILQKIKIIQAMPECSWFETPSLRMVYYISKYIMSEVKDYDYQFLYLHTKGVSYRTDYQQISDERNMMLYFMVELHRSCYHILKSNMFDAVGVNYDRVYEHQSFRGNFWWAKCDYIASLKPLLFKSSSHLKYDAEVWIGSGKPVRLYIMHESALQHSNHMYPRSLYELKPRFNSQVVTNNTEHTDGLIKMKLLSDKNDDSSERNSDDSSYGTNRDDCSMEGQIDVTNDCYFDTLLRITAEKRKFYRCSAIELI